MTTAKEDKESTGPGVSLPDLPDDIIRAVLLLLPSRSIARFRCVCRSWNTETSSPSFLDRRHELVAATKFAFVPRCCWGRCSGSRCPKVIGAKNCRGVVLVVQHPDWWLGCNLEPRTPPFFFVCNPTTGEVLRLPPPDQTLVGNGASSRIISGIGYHRGEYKVVQICALLDNNQHGRVITIGDARGWRALPLQPAASFPDDDATIDWNMHPVFADGHIHWCFSCSRGILSFSIADESFRRTPQLPFVRTDDARSVARLAELDGRLCIVRDVRWRNDVPGQFEVWKLQDYETGACSLDYRIDLTGRVARRMRGPSYIVPLEYIHGNGGEKRKMLLVTSEQRAQVYDPNTNSLRTVASMAGRSGLLDINGRLPWRCDSSLRILMYQESNVRFPGMEPGETTKIRFDELEYINKV